MSEPTLLTPDQWRTLEALVDCIIPADDYPSGWQAGVGDYLARQFTRDLADVLPQYRLGLAALDAEAHAQYSHAFADLAPNTRGNLLFQIEADAVQTPWSTAPSGFFKMVIEHTHEGYYSDPGNGGNHDSIAWQMIGYRVTA
jgi:Gluconate 2-dehydrogenase subunit 3